MTFQSIFDDPPFESVFERDNGRHIRQRNPVCFGPVRLSVQASSFSYSNPRVDGLPLREYKQVEIALIRSSDDAWLYPSDLVDYDGPSDEECNFNGDDVAPYVPQAVVRRLEEALDRWANGPDPQIRNPTNRGSHATNPCKEVPLSDGNNDDLLTKWKPMLYPFAATP